MNHTLRPCELLTEHIMGPWDQTMRRGVLYSYPLHSVWKQQIVGNGNYIVSEGIWMDQKLPPHSLLWYEARMWCCQFEQG